MSIDCYCDYDEPEFYRSEIIKARKPHKCGECRGVILPGEPYSYATGKWEGDFDTFKTCERCHDLYVWTKNNVPCLCPIHGQMDQQMEEAIYDAKQRAPKETVGLWFGYRRRKLARDKLNQSRKNPLTSAQQEK